MGPSSQNSILDFFLVEDQSSKNTKQMQKTSILEKTISFFQSFREKITCLIFFVHFVIQDHNIKVIKNWILPSRTNFWPQNFPIKIYIFFYKASERYILPHQLLSNCPENQFQLGKNSSVRDFNFFMIDLVMVNYAKSIKNHPLTQEVLVSPV